jgi:hypothetical protein
MVGIAARREVGNRNTRRFQIRLRAARLRHSQAAIEDVDYRTPRRLDKALFQQLAAPLGRAPRVAGHWPDRACFIMLTFLSR